MMTVEREISSIETANINKETMDAMKNASVAMRHIHNGITIDKVDATMCVGPFFPFSFLPLSLLAYRSFQRHTIRATESIHD